MNKINVKAAEGLKVPREDNPRRYITSEATTEVQDTAYYRRQVAAGDLIIITADDGKAVKKEQKKTTEVTSEQP